jgi:DNA primase
MSSLKISELTGLLNKVCKDTGRLRKGNNLVLHCPFCNHHKRKLEVCLDEPWFWHCWTCNKKGRGLYWLFKGLDVSLDTISKLENIVGKHVPKKALSEFDTKIASLNNKDIVRESVDVLSLPDEFKSLIDNDGSRDYKVAMNYAKKRNLSICDIIKHNIGYCPRGSFANRLVFPSYDKNNNLNFYSCRSYFDDGYKYKNSEANKNIVGFENLVDFDFPIYLCEGALDAISIKRNAIPLFGKTMSKKLKSVIIQSKCPEVNIVLDDDALDSAIRIAEYINSIGKVAKLVQLKGKDPNILGFAKTMEQIRKTEVLDFRALTMLRLE